MYYWGRTVDLPEIYCFGTVSRADLSMFLFLNCLGSICAEWPLMFVLGSTITCNDLTVMI